VFALVGDTYICRQLVISTHPSVCHTDEPQWVKQKQLSVALPSFVWGDWGDDHWFLVNRIVLWAAQDSSGLLRTVLDCSGQF